MGGIQLQHLQIGDFVSQSCGSANLIKRVLEDLRIAETIDSAVKADVKSWKRTPGTHVEALIINALRDRQPLYKVCESMAELDLPLLFGPDVRAEDFNDDALGRTLDALAQITMAEVFSSIALNAAAVFGVSIDRLHADTTSVSLFGEYKNKKGKIKIDRGFSKDKRGDLKQIVLGLMVNAEGYPTYGDVVDGNKDDKTWNKEVIQGIDALTKCLGPDIIYIADSCAVTGPNLRAAKKQHLQLISRVPATFSLVNELKEEAWKLDDWTVIGKLRDDPKAAIYKIRSLPGIIEDVTYRCIVVHTSTLDILKEKKLQRRLKRQCKEVRKELKALSKTEFACVPDAQNACAELEEKWSQTLYGVTLEIKENVVPKKRGRGRPKKGVPVPTRTYYSVQGTIQEPTEDEINTIREKMASFVLLTNVSEERLSDVEVLIEYKGQSSVEKRFSFLKDPEFIDSIYLKNPDRVYALGFIFLFGLLIAAYIESIVRRELKRNNKAITVPGGRIQQNPTLRSLLDLLNTVKVIIEQTANGLKRHLSADLNPDVRTIIRLLGYDMSIYTS